MHHVFSMIFSSCEKLSNIILHDEDDIHLAAFRAAGVVVAGVTDQQGGIHLEMSAVWSLLQTRVGAVNTAGV